MVLEPIAALAGIVAVTWVVDTTVVGIAAPRNKTTEPATKFVPVTETI